MKRIFSTLVILAAALMFSNTASAQKSVGDPVFYKGDNIVSLTIGYGWGFGQRLAYEHAVATFLNDKASIGVGGAIGNNFRSRNYGYGVSYFEDRIGISVVGSFHYQFTAKLDTYVQLGFGGGYWMYKWKDDLYDDYYNAYANHAFFDVTSSLGVRYYFSPKWAVNAELGWTAGSYIMAGITHRF